VDANIIDRVGELIEQERALRRSAEHQAIDTARLRELEQELDQCWDLLRQRRARRAAGLDPSEAGARPTEFVERYRQ
jgi:hypothetical protein